ncbi:hypothetical protein [Metallosphaera hakonensis]|uniref:hypothetical protein n=1 Tax=Metallosphaera hakonensis TaxID=79601 RepID=UPI000AB413A6|nr:hypothetical protein [Metallosphaera hakonensis]
MSKAQLEERQKEIQKAKNIVEEGLIEFEKDCLNLVYDDFVSSFMSKIEEIRKEEVERAQRELGDQSEDTKEVLDAMTRSMIKKIFSPMFANLKTAVEANEVNYINLATSLFSHGWLSKDKAEEIKAEQNRKRLGGGDSVNS